ncbi:flagellar hook-length control protein FliK [Noviherbaspirillum pedocola]|uniref:Flagellar hook-length control protein FliK n=1 Tax=Noviherbaspirillum pedocola TaxID=2801341 RepID=A0A934SV83_9BURK|nr:flagellar hook-length control protein FliK [Noviherbaspirillum pedocola]MBK4736357.1 flagellar hook-length control protein FliK [Noviherbaspirillum pedocola]
MAGGISNPSPILGQVSQIAPARAVAALGDTGGESLRRLMGLEVGKAFAAQVLSRLPGGEYLVGIAGTVAKMALPQGAAVGDALSLTLIGREPRPVFLLPNDAAPAAGATFSPAAQLIDSLMRQERGDAVIARSPLLADTAAAQEAAPPLADALRTALEHSGLFYESHVAQWAAGQRTMEALLREPQMQMQSAISNAAANAAAGVGALVDPSSADSALANASIASQAAPDAAMLAAMQLDTLDSHRVAWQGELFPGQPLHWEVRAEDEGTSARQESGGTPERAWHSAIRIDLPELGAVEARLALRGNRLQLQVDAADIDAADTMRRAGASLATALEAAGITVEGLTVRHGQA